MNRTFQNVHILNAKSLFHTWPMKGVLHQNFLVTKSSKDENRWVIKAVDPTIIDCFHFDGAQNNQMQIEFKKGPQLTTRYFMKSRVYHATKNPKNCEILVRYDPDNLV